MERSAIMGALSLYLDFLNLFTMLLRCSASATNSQSVWHRIRPRLLAGAFLLRPIKHLNIR